MLVVAPSIHLMKIGPCPISKLYCRNLSGCAGVSQWNCFAISPQNSRGSSIDCSYFSLYCSQPDTWASCTSLAMGGNTLSSCVGIFNSRYTITVGKDLFPIESNQRVCPFKRAHFLDVPWHRLTLSLHTPDSLYKD